mgnify:FL=1
MSQDDDSDKSFEPTEQKLKKAREKGEVAKSTDLSVAASYLGLVVAFYAAGAGMVSETGTVLMSLFDQPDRLADQLFSGNATPPVGGMIGAITRPLVPLFMIPAILVLLSILGQKALVFAPSKLEPKLSRISIISNAKNKFGRSGLFEFAKSAFKLTIYSICLGVYLSYRMPEMIASSGTGAFSVIKMLSELGMEFLVIALLVALPIGVVDAAFQHAEHRRKNMMSRKEVQDEHKDAEGDPHMKAKRRQKAQAIALGQMMGAVPDASVVIVNPTHYAVALKWEGGAGTAPVCVAKGVDEVAAAIRKVANEKAVPIHSDPPTARALYATIEIGEEIHEEYYAPVAAAIRFAEEMRERAKGGI